MEASPELPVTHKNDRHLKKGTGASRALDSSPSNVSATADKSRNSRTNTGKEIIPSELASPVSRSGKGIKRRKIDFSEVDLLEIARQASGPGVLDSIGGLTSRAEVELWAKPEVDVGKVDLEVDFKGLAVRATEPKKKYVFILFVDYSGFASILASRETYKTIIEHISEQKAKQSKACLMFRVQGFVQAKRSTRGHGEMFLALKDTATITRICLEKNMVPNTCFAAILHTCKENKNREAKFGSIAGICAVQRFFGKKFSDGEDMTLSLRDATGYAVINISGYPRSVFMENDLQNSTLRIQGQISFQVSKALCMEVVSASVKFEEIILEKIESSVFSEFEKVVRNFAARDIARYQFKEPLLADPADKSSSDEEADNSAS